jgi:hypothetical protein
MKLLGTFIAVLTYYPLRLHLYFSLEVKAIRESKSVAYFITYDVCLIVGSKLEFLKLE